MVSYLGSLRITPSREPRRHFVFSASSSLAHPPVKGYICGSVDVVIFAAKGEGSPTCPPFAGHRRGRSLRNTHVLNRGPHGVVRRADAI